MTRAAAVSPALTEALAALAESGATPMLLYRDDVLWANRAAAKLTGYSLDELVGRPLRALVDPENWELARIRAFPHREAHAEATECDLRIVRSDGTRRWTHLAGLAVPYDDEAATLATLTDVTDHKALESNLRELRDRQQLAERVAGSTHWEWEPDTDALTFSENADRLFGFAIREVVTSGDDLRGLIHPEDQPRLQRGLRGVLKGTGDLAVDIRVLTPNGDVIWLTDRAIAMRDPRGRVERVIGIARDITDRKITEDALYKERERAHVTLAAITDGVVRTDPNGRIDYLNAAAQRITGWLLAEAYGQPAVDIIRLEDERAGRPVASPIEHCLAAGRPAVGSEGAVLVRRDGRRLGVTTAAAPLRDRAGAVTGAVLILGSAGGLEADASELAERASHDELTGLLNRYGFERAIRDLKAGQPHGHAVALIDLDQFQLINESCGTEAGDRVLRDIAAIVDEALGPSAETAGRVGGCQFAVLYEERPLTEARRRVRELIDAIRQYRFDWEGTTFATGVSAGLVATTATDGGPMALLAAAEAACYKARDGGGNRVHLFKAGDATAAERHGGMRWISDLQAALDEGRLRLYRQDLQRLDESVEEGPVLAELLVRLHHDEGLIEPAAFIPAAERYGLVTTIDRWVLQTLLAELGRSGNGTSRFAVNVSGASVGDETFLDEAIHALETSGVAPNRVLFEITETAAIRDLRSALRFIAVLKAMGCRFVLDDFGKGVSSLSYLRELPVDYLKIDGRFVRDLAVDPVQQALVAAIHNVARVLGLATIAEEVENRDTLEALRRIGVDYAQGFYVGEPKPFGTSSGTGA